MTILSFSGLIHLSGSMDFKFEFHRDIRHQKQSFVSINFDFKFFNVSINLNVIIGIFTICFDARKNIDETV